MEGTRLKRLLIAILIIAVLFASVWEVLALLYAGHGEGAVARAIAVAVLVLGSLAAFIWLRPFWRALAIWGVGFLAVLIWFNTLRPTNDRDWQPDVAKVAWAEVSGDKLTFHNVRDFDYRSETDFTPRYDDRVYDLAKLRGRVISAWASATTARSASTCCSARHSGTSSAGYCAAFRGSGSPSRMPCEKVGS